MRIDILDVAPLFFPISRTVLLKATLGRVEIDILLLDEIIEFLAERRHLSEEHSVKVAMLHRRRLEDAAVKALKRYKPSGTAIVLDLIDFAVEAPPRTRLHLVR